VNLTLPFPDAMQEFRVETSSQNAQNGYKAGGTVSIATKAGTNLFHGDVFEFTRHHRFNSTSPFAPINRTTGERADDGLVDDGTLACGARLVVADRDPREAVTARQAGDGMELVDRVPLGHRQDGWSVVPRPRALVGPFVTMKQTHRHHQPRLSRLLQSPPPRRCARGAR